MWKNDESWVYARILKWSEIIEFATKNFNVATTNLE